MLKSADVDRSFFGCIEIASAHAKIAGRANHAAGETERIIRENRPRRAIIILVGDGSDKRLDVQLGGTGFLARRIDALQATRRFLQSPAFTQGSVLDIVKILRQGSATLKERKKKILYYIVIIVLLLSLRWFPRIFVFNIRFV